MVEESAVKVLEVAEEHLNAPGAKGVDPAFRALSDNSLDSFRNGACLDLRVRLAMELLAHSQMWNKINIIPGKNNEASLLAGFALDVATELFSHAESRGLIVPLDDPGNAAWLNAHIERQAAFAVEQQKAQARAQEEAGEDTEGRVSGVQSVMPAPMSIRENEIMSRVAQYRADAIVVVLGYHDQRQFMVAGDAHITEVVGIPIVRKGTAHTWLLRTGMDGEPVLDVI